MGEKLNLISRLAEHTCKLAVMQFAHKSRFKKGQERKEQEKVAKLPNKIGLDY